MASPRPPGIFHTPEKYLNNLNDINDLKDRKMVGGK
jgi:hypothetical protein